MRQSCLVVIALVFSFLAISSAQAQTDSEAMEKLHQSGFQALQPGETSKARPEDCQTSGSNGDPSDERGYRIEATASFVKGDMSSVVSTVQLAKANRIDSLFLYKDQTMTLFILRDLGLAMQGFREIEDSLMRHVKGKGQSFRLGRDGGRGYRRLRSFE